MDNAQAILLVAAFAGVLAFSLGMRHCSGHFSDASPFFGRFLLLIAGMCAMVILGCIIAIQQAGDQARQAHDHQAISSHTGLLSRPSIF